MKKFSAAISCDELAQRVGSRFLAEEEGDCVGNPGGRKRKKKRDRWEDGR